MPRLFGGSLPCGPACAPQFGGVVDGGGAPAGRLYIQLISALMVLGAPFFLVFFPRSTREIVVREIVASALIRESTLSAPLQCFTALLAAPTSFVLTVADTPKYIVIDSTGA